MNKHEIRIQVEGQTATGKTTICLIIAEALRAKGYQVNVDDSDGDNKKAGETLVERIKHLAPITEVSVTQVQSRSA